MGIDNISGISTYGYLSLVTRAGRGDACMYCRLAVLCSSSGNWNQSRKSTLDLVARSELLKDLNKKKKKKRNRLFYRNAIFESLAYNFARILFLIWGIIFVTFARWRYHSYDTSHRVMDKKNFPRETNTNSNWKSHEKKKKRREDDRGQNHCRDRWRRPRRRCSHL